MRNEYNINNLNPQKKPYSNQNKSQIIININSNTIEYFQEQSQKSGIPYQTLISLYLSDCAEHKRKLDIS